MGIATRIERIISKGQLVPLHFSQSALAISQTDVQLGTGDDLGTAAGYRMPFAGEIIAITYVLSTAKTAGVMTVGPTVGGTEIASARQTVANASVGGGSNFKRGTSQFPAGSVIGVELTTDASFLPITADLVAVVWVLLSIEGV
jgi:hypothetical protein